MEQQIWQEVGEFLVSHNLTIFTFPDMESGEVFWLINQPSLTPVSKGKTLVEALERAGYMSIVAGDAHEDQN